MLLSFPIDSLLISRPIFLVTVRASI